MIYGQKALNNELCGQPAMDFPRKLEKSQFSVLWYKTGDTSQSGLLDSMKITFTVVCSRTMARKNSK